MSVTGAASPGEVTVPALPATPKSEPPSRMRSGSASLNASAARSDSYSGPWLGPRPIQLASASRRYSPSGAVVVGPLDIAYITPDGDQATLL